MKVCLRPGVMGRHYTSSGRSFKPQGKLAVCHGVSPARQRVNTGRTLQSMFLAGITPKKPTRCSGNAPDPASAPACWQPDVPQARRRPTWRPRQDAAYEASGQAERGAGRLDLFQRVAGTTGMEVSGRGIAAPGELLGHRLRLLRTRMGLSRRQVADESGLRCDHVIRGRGRCGCNVTSVEAIGMTLGAGLTPSHRGRAGGVLSACGNVERLECVVDAASRPGHPV